MRADGHTPPRPRRPSSLGFTLVEVVIAIALTAMIVLAVTAVTRASAQTAQRVKDATADEARLAVALNVLRRDLAGWYEPPRAAQRPITTPANPAPGEILLSFETLADGLAPSASPHASPARSGVRVEYLLCPRGETYDLLRRERTGNATTDLTLLSTVEPVRLEFHDGTTWQSKWTLPTRPMAARLKATPVR